MAEELKDKKTDDSIPFFPDHALTEFWVGLVVLGILFVIGIIGQFKPIGLGEPADPFNTPLHAKPEWYFLFLYQLLKYVPKTVGVLAPIIGIVLFMLLPFLDRKREDSKRARNIRVIGVVVFFVIAIILTILGEIT